MNKKIPQIGELFETSDLSLATTLSLFLPIDSINRANPRKVAFVFKANPALRKTLEAYWRQELTVEPQAFFSQLKVLKTRIYDQN